MAVRHERPINPPHRPRHPPSSTTSVRHVVRLLAAAAAACALSATTRVAAAAAEVGGTIQFQKIRYEEVGGAGKRVFELRPDKAQLQPAARVTVEVVAAADSDTLATGTTDDNGRFELKLPEVTRPIDVRVWVLAEADNAKVIQGLVAGERLYAVRSEVFQIKPAHRATVDLVALDEHHAAGPFNILAVIQRANAVVRRVGGDQELPLVTMQWSPRHSPGTQFKPDPMTRKGMARINGDRRIDSDEFDDPVIIHEYAHFLCFHFSRSDSPGGKHYEGERLDPRLAWSEGWATFFACITTGSPQYVDTKAAARAGRPPTSFSMNLEEDVPPGDQPGFWSEHSVGSVLWDMFAPDAFPDPNHLGLDFQHAWASFTALKQESYVYLIDFCDHLVVNHHARAGQIAKVLQTRKITYQPGKSPPVPEPFPIPIGSGAPAHGRLDSATTYRENLYESSAFYSFEVKAGGAPTADVHIQLKTLVDRDDDNPANFDLLLFDGQGTEICYSAVGGATESIDMDLPPGSYVIEVRSWSKKDFHAGNYTLTATY